MIRNAHHLITKIPLRRLRQLRPLSSGKEATLPTVTAENGGGGGGVISREEAYREIQNLDFMKAAKILFTTSPKRKEFGFDFHLVQFFFACMPSLAVYLVAQYARHEIRRMEAEAELKKKKAEEEEAKAREKEKAEEAELHSLEDGSTDSDLSKVIVRLDALEEVVKEIVDEKKKSDPQVKSKASEPKPELNKETASSSSSKDAVPADNGQKNKEKASPIPGSAAPTGSNPTATPIAVRPLVGGPSIAAILSSPTTIRGATESPTAAVSSSLVTSVNLVKDDDNAIFPVRRPSPAIPEIALGRGISRVSTPASINPVSGITGNGALGSVSAVSDMTKRNNLSIDERMGNGGLTPYLVSPLCILWVIATSAYLLS